MHNTKKKNPWAATGNLISENGALFASTLWKSTSFHIFMLRVLLACTNSPTHQRIYHFDIKTYWPTFPLHSHLEAYPPIIILYMFARISIYLLFIYGAAPTIGARSHTGCRYIMMNFSKNYYFTNRNIFYRNEIMEKKEKIHLKIY